jgi:hypothetical protein
VNIGIVGHAGEKFTPETEQAARHIIRTLLTPPDTVLVSGGCHMGGVDIYAEEEADAIGRKKIIHLPKRRTWDGGYKQRNLLIARDADEMHVIVVADYPPNYDGMRFGLCYHCDTDSHIKSGGCWTGKQAERLGKKAVWHVV